MDEKFPIGRCPFYPFAVFSACYPVKTDPVASDEIEFLSNIGQRRLRTDSRDDAANVEEFGCSAEKRFVVRVEAESAVAEELAKVEKITGAAAKIENVERWRTVEPKVLHALDVYVDPVSCIFVCVDPSRIGPVGITLAQPL